MENPIDPAFSLGDFPPVHLGIPAAALFGRGAGQSHRGCDVEGLGIERRQGGGPGRGVTGKLLLSLVG